jgi:hypothetical protein
MIDKNQNSISQTAFNIYHQYSSQSKSAEYSGGEKKEHDLFVMRSFMHFEQRCIIVSKLLLKERYLFHYSVLEHPAEMCIPILALSLPRLSATPSIHENSHFEGSLSVLVMYLTLHVSAQLAIIRCMRLQMKIVVLLLRCCILQFKSNIKCL